jgi:hypothetical protein
LKLHQTASIRRPKYWVDAEEMADVLPCLAYEETAENAEPRVVPATPVIDASLPLAKAAKAAKPAVLPAGARYEAREGMNHLFVFL